MADARETEAAALQAAAEAHEQAFGHGGPGQVSENEEKEDLPVLKRPASKNAPKGKPKGKAKSKGKPKTSPKPKVKSSKEQDKDAGEDSTKPLKRKHEDAGEDPKGKKAKGEAPEPKGGKDEDNDKKKKGKAKDKDEERAKKLQLEEPEEPAPEESAVEAAEEPEHRDPKKAWYFNKVLSTMPEPVQALFRSTTISRKEKTKLVHACVGKDDKGKWVSTPNNAVVESMSNMYSELVGREKAKGMPKALMLGRLGGGEEALERALRDGDVKCIQQNGKTFYFFEEVEICRSKGKVEATKSSMQNNTPGLDELNSFQSFLTNFKPTFNEDEGDVNFGLQNPPSSGSSGPDGGALECFIYLSEGFPFLSERVF